VFVNLDQITPKSTTLDGIAAPRPEVRRAGSRRSRQVCDAPGKFQQPVIDPRRQVHLRQAQPNVADFINDELASSKLHPCENDVPELALFNRIAPEPANLPQVREGKTPQPTDVVGESLF